MATCAIFTQVSTASKIPNIIDIVRYGEKETEPLGDEQLLFQQFHKTHIILANSQLIAEYFVGSRNQSSTRFQVIE